MLFYYANALREILGELDFSECTTNNYMFQNCTNLVRVTPKANSIKISTSVAHSSKLDDISIQAFVDGLVDLTGQTAQTLTLNKTVHSVLTDEQLTQIFNKNWSVE